jgi:superfamily II DNA/RNA helicase
MSFEELGLSAEVLAAVRDAGYQSPTPIQEKGIPQVLAGRDLIGIAQTGTGKTASFCLPMICKLSRGRARARMPRSLILEPTRELAAQVVEEFEKLGKNHKLTVGLLIGGVSYGDQDLKLDRGVDVLIATPGRMLDHFERGKLLLNGIEILVIDEADRMLDMGFIPDVERICKLIPFTRQTLFYSATMPPEIQKLTNAFLQNPVRIEVTPQATAAETVTQSVCMVGDKEKREALRRLIKREGVKNAIIFCNRKRDVATLYRALERSGFSVAALHGDMDQRARTLTLDSFRKGEIMLLVASDVAARGLDIPEVSHIFNFDVPMHAEDYIHRIGRTGRAGRSGRAITLCTPHDGKSLAAVEKMLNCTLTREADLGLLPSAIAESEPASKGDARARGGRGRGRGRNDGRHRDQAPRDRAAAPAPASAQSQHPSAAPRSVPRHEPRAPDAQTASAPRPRHAEPRLHDKPRHEHAAPAHKPADKLVSFGEHTPAFLLRPVRPARPVEDEEGTPAPVPAE